MWDRITGDMDVIWGKSEAKYFLEKDWTGQIRLIRSNKFAVSRKSVKRARLEAEAVILPSRASPAREVRVAAVAGRKPPEGGFLEPTLMIASRRPSRPAPALLPYETPHENFGLALSSPGSGWQGGSGWGFSPPIT
jgi:hypothetical protein